LCFICAETKFLTNNPQIIFKEIVVEIEFGEGSYGKVFLGKWNDAPVALKFCRNNVKFDEFISQIKIMA
jgi:predicted Ser/Thr protein kinase